ncbi:MAG: hypothetical protein ACXIUM_07190 [Wenzhouxiangella sp.]
MSTLELGQPSQPRYEFRSFGQQFDQAHQRMGRLSVPVPEALWERRSEEIYILSRSNDINNTKIRNGKMDIKTLIQTVDGLEQWQPLLKTEFPLAASTLNEAVIPALQVDSPSLDLEQVSLDEFLDLVRGHPELQAVRVAKQRFAYQVNATLCEFAHVLINGARVASINSESTEIRDIHQTLAEIGLAGVENINYLQAIKRVIGWIDRPLAK